MLEAAGISRRYGWRWALRGVDLAVAPGRPLALLGANGSGKTTLLKIIAGLIRPTEGKVLLDGGPIASAAHGRIGLLSHEAFLYPALTLGENLRFCGRLFGLPTPRIEERIALLMEALNLADRLDDPVHTLSQGLRQRSALARALLHDPEIVLLDEPFAGLDPAAAERLEATVSGLCGHGAGEDGGRGRILILTSHDVGRARTMAAEVAVLSAGRMAIRGASSDLSEETILRAYREGEGAGKVPSAVGTRRVREKGTA